MAIKFTNIRTGETRVAKTEPMLAAFYNSSDQGPNSHEGQDFGWRLAPETLRRMREIRRDVQVLAQIKAAFQLVDEPSDTDVLRWISEEEARKQGEVSQQDQEKFARKYQDDVRAIEDEDQVPETPSELAPAPEPKNEVPPEPTPEPSQEDTSDADDGGTEEEKAEEAASVKPAPRKSSNKQKKTDNAKIEEPTKEG